MSQLGDDFRLAAGVANPIDDPDLYDAVLLGGAWTPGVADVAGAGDPRKWDKQDGKGQSGATIKYNGRGLAEFDIVLTFTERRHFDAWRTFKVVLEPPEGASPTGLDIVHPLLEDVGITSVVVQNVSQITQPEPGIYQVTISLLQNRAPVPTHVVPVGSGGASVTTANVAALQSVTRRDREDNLEALGGGPEVPGLVPGSWNPADDEADDQLSDLLAQLNNVAS